MTLPEIATRDEWVAARKALLAKEKELTHARDALNTERRQLPMVEVENDYVFQGRRVVLLPGPDRAGPAGGVGRAQGPQRRRAVRQAGLRVVRTRP